MKIFDIEAYFQSIYPSERSCPWDNDGLLVCADREREVHSVLTCLDVTFTAIEKAIREGCELIVSHHPLIFSPIKSVNEDSIVGQKVLLLIQNGISLISLHTRFDGAVGGLNEHFGKSLGLIPLNAPPILPDEPFIGAVGLLAKKLNPDELALRVADTVKAPVRLYSAGLSVEKVAFCCGAAQELVLPALEQGADAFIGGDISYHIAQEAAERGMTVVDCGHHASEKASPFLFCDALSAFSSKLKVIPFSEATGGEFVGF